MWQIVSKIEFASGPENCHGSHAVAHGLLGGNSQHFHSKIHVRQAIKFRQTYLMYKKGLGKLAEKFPNIAGTSISYLKDFLIDPSPILSKLYIQAQQKKDKEPFKIVGKYQNASFTFEFSKR